MNTLTAKELADSPHAVGIVYDTVIVGAGTIGLLIARDLISHGQRVCLVEAGGCVALRPAGVFATKSVGRPHAGVVMGRAVGLGGTSTLWGGQLARFTPEDLRRPGFEWPVNYETLERYYDRVSDALGVPRPRPTEDYLRAFGCGDAPSGSMEPFYTQWLPQPNMAALFREALEASDAVDLILNGAVHAFAFDGERVRGVILFAAGGQTVEIRERDIVLAAGTIGNVQILLSAPCHGAVPWAANPHLGAYFQDHLGGKAASAEILDESAFRRLFENGFALNAKMQPKIRPKNRALDRPSVCGFFAFHSRFSDQMAHMKRMVRSAQSGLSMADLRSLPATALGLARVMGPIVSRYLVERRIRALYDGGVDFTVQAEQWPVKDSRIAPAANQPTAEGLLPVRVEWRLDGRESAEIAAFVYEAGRYLEEAGLARLTPEPWLSDGPDPDLPAMGDTYHQCGGARMSATPEDGVTDPELKVWGTDNLYVAGAATLPTSSYANCTYTAMALGLRVADRITRSAEVQV